MDDHLFVHELPPIAVEDGIVCVRYDGKCWHWRPSVFRRFVEEGRNLLNDWDRARMEPVPIKKRRR